MNGSAPLIVIAYNRPQALSGLIDIIAREQAIESRELWFFRDGPKTESDRLAQAAITNLIENKCSGLNYRYIRSPINKGLGNSVIGAVTTVLDKHETAIVLEDDLEPAPGFLKYFDTALARYQNHPDVLSISGYLDRASSLRLSPFGVDTFLCRRPTTWGWATWREAWNACNWDSDFYSNLEKDPVFRTRLRQLGADVLPWLRDYLAGVVDSWGIRWTAHHVLMSGYAVYPTEGRIRNNGVGIDGTNTLFGGDLRLKSTGDTKQIESIPQCLPETFDSSLEDQYLRQFRTVRYRRRVITRRTWPVTRLKRVVKLIYRSKKALVS